MALSGFSGSDPCRVMGAQPLEAARVQGTSWTRPALLFFFFLSLNFTLVAQTVKRLPIMQETRVWSLGWEDTLEKAMATHSSTLAWKIPWTEEPGGLQSMGSLGVEHDWATSLSLSCIGEGHGNPLQCSCLEYPRDGGAWWAAFYGVTQSRTRLKGLHSSSSRDKRLHYRE